jgi:hypothetical protein
MNNPEILIATPAYEGNFKTGYVKSLFAQKMLNEQRIKHDYMTIEISDIATARNYFASYMLERPRGWAWDCVASPEPYSPISRRPENSSSIKTE